MITAFFVFLFYFVGVGCVRSAKEQVYVHATGNHGRLESWWKNTNSPSPTRQLRNEVTKTMYMKFMATQTLEGVSADTFNRYFDESKLTVTSAVTATATFVTSERDITVHPASNITAARRNLKEMSPQADVLSTTACIVAYTITLQVSANANLNQTFNATTQELIDSVNTGNFANLLCCSSNTLVSTNPLGQVSGVVDLWFSDYSVDVVEDSKGRLPPEIMIAIFIGGLTALVCSLVMWYVCCGASSRSGDVTDSKKLPSGGHGRTILSPRFKIAVVDYSYHEHTSEERTTNRMALV